MKKLLPVLFSLVSICTIAQVPVINSVSGPANVCSAPAAPSSYTVSATNSPSSYLWVVSPSSGVVITNGTTSVATISFPSTTTSFTITCYASNGFGSSAPANYAVNVFGTPNVTFSGATSFCQGSSTALQASSTILPGSPTINYSWAPPTGLNTTSGANVVAMPASSTVYTVTATAGNCSSTSTIGITVHNNPVLAASISQTAPCLGSTVVVNVTGAQNYTFTGPYSNGVPFNVSSLNTINILVTGTDAFGCQDTLIADIYPVNPPSISVVPNPSVICSGSTGTLGITGSGTTYTLNTTPLTMNGGWAYVPISPTTTTSYTISTTDASNGCTNNTVYTQSVSSCVGIKENVKSDRPLSVYPNPGAGTFTIKTSAAENVSIINELGQIIQIISVRAEKETYVSGLSKGIYFVITSTTRMKLVVTD